MPTQAPERPAADALRFLIAGAINTALTAAIYFACLAFASPTLSYAVAWLAGLGFVMVFYPDRVFVGGARSTRARLSLGVLTIAVFLVGILTLRLLIAVTGEARVAFLLTLGLTTVLNFVGGRTLLRQAA